MKARSMSIESGYEFIDVTVMDGVASLRYRINGSKVTGSDRHDEDVSDWTDQQIRELVCDLLGLDKKYAREIDIEHP